MVRRIFTILITALSTNCLCYTSSYNIESHNLDDYYASEKNKKKMVKKTTDALLAYDLIERRADYFVFKLKNLTFGEYSDQVLFLAPVVTGKVEVRAYNLNFYYDYNRSKSGVKYTYRF